MKTKETAGTWARRAFPSFRKLPTLLLSHPSAELRAQKSRAAVGSQLVPFRSVRIPKGSQLLSSLAASTSVTLP